jgi:hypothetical protein
MTSHQSRSLWGTGQRYRSKGTDRDRIIEFVKNLEVVKLRDSRGIYGWNYLLALYSGEERRQILSFIYSEGMPHPEWVMYGDYILFGKHPLGCGRGFVFAVF